MELSELFGIAVSLLTLPLLGYWAVLIYRVREGAAERLRRSNQRMALRWSRIRKEEEFKDLGCSDAPWANCE